MALYACGEDDLVYASDAEKGKLYGCLDCFGPVKVRKGKGRFPHFYHLQASPQCRLYSKSEDHLRAQIQLQKLFPQGILQIERPFPEIGRVADLCWEKEKIIFEIQCSPVSLQEAQSRIRDYRTFGFRVVWLLDDKRYNRRILRPSEEFLRRRSCYYIDIKQGLTSICYDQFEIQDGTRRLKRGRRLTIDLQKPIPVPNQVWEKERFPEQIHHLSQQCEIHFYGDRIDKARLSYRISAFAISMENWRFLESHFIKKRKRYGKLKEWVRKWIGRPYNDLLMKILRRFN